MSYTRPISGGGGSNERWPKAEERITLLQGVAAEIRPDNLGMAFRPSDVFIEYPLTVQGDPVTHLMVIRGGVSHTLGTWIPVATPELISDSYADGCTLDETVIVDCYVSTDGVTNGGLPVQTYYLIQSEQNQCDPP